MVPFATFLLIIFVGRTGAQNEQPCCAVASSIISQFSRQQLEALDRVTQTTEARYSQITQSVQVVADKQQRDELKLSQVQSQLEQQMQELRVELQRQVDLIANGSQSCQQQHEQQGVARNCMDIQKSGETQSGVYTVHVASRSIQVYCDMVTDGGGWLVIQRRVDGSQNFRLGWNDYAAGFGSVAGEFWLGNRNIHLLTSTNQDVSLRFDLADGEGEKRYAQYDYFQVMSEAEKFKLIISGYTGDAGDAMSAIHNGMKFSTIDQDNDIYSKNCAVQFKGAWWYAKCHSANPNGLYLNGTHTSYADGIEWSPWKGQHYSLQFFEIKIRPHY